jgi:SNF2-related domain
MTAIEGITERKTFGTLTIEGDKFVLNGLPPHVSRKLKNQFPRIEREATQPFKLTGGPALAVDLDWFLYRFPMRMTDEVRNYLIDGKATYEQAQADVISVLGKDYKPTQNPRFKDGLQPYPYQAQAAEIAHKLGRLLLTDDVGLGKTIAALDALTRPGRLPAAIVVQSHLTKQWRDEYVHRFTNLRCHIIKRTAPYELPPADIYIFKYNQLAGWVDYIAAHEPFKSVVWDEIQELRHGDKTKKGRAAQVLADRVELRLGLSATPIFNYGAEMFNVMQYIDRDCLGSYVEFLTEWCHSNGSHWMVTDPVALGSHLRDMNLSLNRDELAAGWKMPPLNVITHTVDHDEAAVEEGRELTRQLALKVLTGSYHERGQAARELDIQMRRDTGIAKARSVAAFVRMLLSDGRHVLLSGWHRAVYDIWAQELAEFNPAFYTGTESGAKKQRSKADFIAGRTRLLIISLRSGAGLDGLQQVCWTGVVGELDWSPEIHKQFFGRLRRPPQTHQVDAIYLVSNFGSDPQILEANGIKRSQSHGIVKATEAMPQQYSDEGRIRKLAEAVLRGEVAPSAPPSPLELPKGTQIAFELEGV